MRLSIVINVPWILLNKALLVYKHLSSKGKVITIGLAPNWTVAISGFVSDFAEGTFVSSQVATFKNQHKAEV